MESRRLARCLLAYIRHHHGEIQLLFELFSAFLVRGQRMLGPWVGLGSGRAAPHCSCCTITYHLAAHAYAGSHCTRAPSAPPLHPPPTPTPSPPHTPHTTTTTTWSSF